ncbi:MAG: protein-L-isoaspartate O-methyltransferase, partial [Haliea sp.]|nr:protein-L-isoaspartate O-methyltransferase [Haliea sp.]
GLGWEEAAPFDGIISTAAPETIPEDLLRQLALGGCMVIPVGASLQQLQVITRTSEGYDTRLVEAVNFVPLRSGTVK